MGNWVERLGYPGSHHGAPTHPPGRRAESQQTRYMPHNFTAAPRAPTNLRRERPPPLWPQCQADRPRTTGKHHAKKGILQTPKPPRRDRWDPEPRAMLKAPNPLQGDVDAPPHSSVGHLRVPRSPPRLQTEPKVDVKGCARSKECRPAFPLTGRAPWKHTPGLNQNHLPDTLQSGAG